MTAALDHLDKSGDCWLWSGYVQSNGYAKSSYQGRTEWVHRIAWRDAFGDIPAGMFVCHHCDVPLCARPDHLFLGTAADNAHDRDAKGRTAKGDQSGPARRDHGMTCRRGHDRRTYTRYQWSARLARMTPYCGRCHADREGVRHRAGRAA